MALWGTWPPQVRAAFRAMQKAREAAARNEFHDHLHDAKCRRAPSPSAASRDTPRGSGAARPAFTFVIFIGSPPPASSGLIGISFTATGVPVAASKPGYTEPKAPEPRHASHG
jgi:hypothetical protein